MKIRKFIIYMCICIFIALLFPIYSHAESSPSGAISMIAVGENVTNGYFLIEKKPGESGSIKVNLRNLSDTYPASSVLFVSDAVVADGGGLGAVTPETAARNNVGKWFSSSDYTIAMNPGEEKDFVLNFTVPYDAKPGDHLGQISIYKYIPSDITPKLLRKNESQIIINKAYLQTIGILIQVPGEKQHHLNLKSFDLLWNGVDLFFNLNIANDGNCIEKSEGTITIFKNNTLVHTQKGKMDSIYPDTAGLYSFAASDTLKIPGKYKAAVEWKYGDETITKTFDFTIKADDVQNAQKVELASQGISVPLDAIIIRPVHIAVFAAIFCILTVIIVLLILRKKKNLPKSQD